MRSRKCCAIRSSDGLRESIAWMAASTFAFACSHTGVRRRVNGWKQGYIHGATLSNPQTATPPVGNAGLHARRVGSHPPRWSANCSPTIAPRRDAPMTHPMNPTVNVTGHLPCTRTGRPGNQPVPASNRSPQPTGVSHATIRSPAANRGFSRPSVPQTSRSHETSPRNQPDKRIRNPYPRVDPPRQRGLSSRAPGGAWRSLVARLLWEQEVLGSNPSAPIWIRRARSSADRAAAF